MEPSNEYMGRVRVTMTWELDTCEWIQDISGLASAARESEPIKVSIKRV